MKKTTLLLLFFILLSISFVSNIYADNNDYFPFTWGIATNNLTIQDFTTTFDDKVTAVWNSWNSIDSNVWISSYTWNADMKDEKCNIKIYEDNLTGTTIGITKFYNDVWYGWSEVQWNYTETIEMSKIYLDNASDGLGTLTDTWIKKTIIHEIGHALAMSHPDCGSDALMQQGQSSPAKSTIQQHDKDNLKAKW